MPKLTKRVVDSTSFPAMGQRFVRDTELAGFALRITKGRKTFVLEKRMHGRVRRVTIGPYGPLTVEQARATALTMAGEIVQGGDPAQARQARHAELTFGELADLYLQRHAVRKRSAHNDISALKRHLQGWRSRRLSAITRNDVATLHAELGAAGHPYGANRVVALLRTMFNLARDWGLYEEENPAARVAFFPETPRDRFLKPDELPRFFKALMEEPNEYVRAAFLVALFTGARRTEVLTMQWPDVDLTETTWRIPQTKSGRPHLIPLPASVAKLLEGLPRLQENPSVFPGRHGRGHLVNVSKSWTRIRTQAGLADVRIHDLRRTLGSWMAGSGEGLPLIGKVLNHRDVSTTAIYARLDLDPVRQALERTAGKLLLAAGKRGPAFPDQAKPDTSTTSALRFFTGDTPPQKKED